MSVMRNILMRAFGRPQGILGRLGGIIMASTNEGCGTWVIDLLHGRGRTSHGLLLGGEGRPGLFVHGDLSWRILQ
jgi:hypothetical protein